MKPNARFRTLSAVAGGVALVSMGALTSTAAAESQPGGPYPADDTTLSEPTTSTTTPFTSSASPTVKASIPPPP